MLLRHVCVTRWGDRRGVRMGDQFDLHAIWVGKCQDLFRAVEASSGPFSEYAFVAQAVLPVVQRTLRDTEGGVSDLASSGVPTAGVWPREEGQNGAGRSSVIAEIEMVGTGIVEVDGALDEAQAEDLGVEVEVSLGV